MPVTVTKEEKAERKVVAGVVADRVTDLQVARQALKGLEGQGFSVVTIPPEALGDASELARLFASLARSGMAPRADPVAPALAALTAVLASGMRTRAAADQLQPAFEAVVDAVTRPQVPSPAWFSQARRNAEARQAFLDEVGALTSEEIASLAGSHAANRRATAHRWQAGRKIFAVTHHGQVLYPGFQFDGQTGRPKPAVADVLAVLPDAMTGWALALWWGTPVDLLGWARPVDRLDTAASEAVAAARAEAADWAQAGLA